MTDELEPALSLKSGDERTKSSFKGLPGRYKIMDVIGSGGMGVVYRAHDLQLERDVAIKVLSSTDDNSNDLSTMRERFVREAQTLASLSHPNIVKLLSWGFNESGELFLVMELLKGKPLAAELHDGNRLSPSRFYQIFCQVLSGLEYLHNQGIVHRDCKPSNIFLCETANAVSIKLLDFGIARTEATASEAQRLTQTGTLLGSPKYMSPEQCKFSAVDKRSDIYSTACMMHEALIGRLPHQAETAIEIMYKHANEDAESLATLAKDPSSRRLGNLIDSCLQKNPDLRPQSASDVLAELNDIFKQKIDTGKLFSELGSSGAATKLKPLLSAVMLILIIVIVLSVGFWMKKSSTSEKPSGIVKEHSELEWQLQQAKSSVMRAERNYATTKPSTRLGNAKTLYERQLTLAKLLRKNKDFKAAEIAVNEALVLCPAVSVPDSIFSLNRAKATVFKDMAMCKVESGHLEDAEKIMESALQLDVHSGEAKASLQLANAKVLLRLNRYSDAFALFQDAMVWCREHDSDLNSRGSYYNSDNISRLPLQSTVISWTREVYEYYPSQIPDEQKSCIDSLRFLNCISKIFIQGDTPLAAQTLKKSELILERCKTASQAKGLEAETKFLQEQLKVKQGIN